MTQEEAESGETLAICLQEIEDCRPFFLCLLGERYGWTPLPPEAEGEHARRLSGDEARLFAEAYYENEGYDEFLLRTERQRQEGWGDEREGNEKTLLAALVRAGVPSAGQSITAQEIYHGVLDDRRSRAISEQMTHSLFYFRDAALTKTLAAEQQDGFYESTDEGSEKLVALKQSIAGAGLQPQPYDGIEKLGQLVLEQLWERITQEFPEERPAPPDPLSEERQAQDLFVQRLTRFFVGREDTLAELDGLVAQGDGYVAVTGPSGCGKTALLANWLYGHEGFVERHPQTLVLSHLIGASTRSASAREILTRFCQELTPLADRTEQLPLDLNELASTFPKILAAAAQRQPILIVIDALDQLEQTDNAHSLYWLPGTLPEGVTLVASSLGGSGEPQEEEHRTWPALQSRAGERVLRVPLFEKPAAEQMIVEYLDQFRKHLSEEQLAALADKVEIGSPLYLQVALNELLTFGEYERVTEYLHGLPGTIPAMYEFVLEHLEREHGQAFVARVMSCLACGRYGMTEQELLASAPGLPVEARSAKAGEDVVTPLSWARLYRILSPHLLKRGEVLGFYHRQLREAVERRYLPDEETKRQTHADIARHFEGQPLTNKRKLEEQPCQQTQGHLWEALLATLTDYDFLEAKVRRMGAEDLVGDHGLALQSWPEIALPQERLRLAEHARAFLQEALHVRYFLTSDTALSLGGFLRQQLRNRIFCNTDGARDLPLDGPDRATTLLVHRRPLRAAPFTLRLLADTDSSTRRFKGAVRFTPDGERVIVAPLRNRVKCFEVETGRELQDYECLGRAIVADFSPAGDRLVVAGEFAAGRRGGFIEVFDAVTARSLAHDRTDALVHGLVTTAGDCTVACHDGTVVVRDLVSLAIKQQFEPYRSAVVGATAINRERTLLATGEYHDEDRAAQITIWNALTLEKIAEYEGPKYGITALAFSDLEGIIVSGSLHLNNGLVAWDWRLAGSRWDQGLLSAQGRAETLAIMREMAGAKNRLRVAA